MKKCVNCDSQFEKIEEEPYNVVFDTDELEVRWDLKDIIRKRDRKMIFNTNSCDNDLCIKCYDDIVANIIRRLKNNIPIDR